MHEPLPLIADTRPEVQNPIANAVYNCAIRPHLANYTHINSP
jgi:hypothetical protein